MAISRDDLVKGGFVFYRTRQFAGGAAVAERKTRVKVLDWNRGAAVVEFENGKQQTIHFSNLEPDDEWMAEHREREREKKARVHAEAAVVAPPPAQKPLTYSLADKLALEEDDDEAASETVAQRREREKALEAIEAMKAPTPPSSNSLEEPAPTFDYRTVEGRTAAARWAIAQMDSHDRSLTWLEAKLNLSKDTVRRWVESVRRGEALRIAGRPAGMSHAMGDAQRAEMIQAVESGQLSQKEAAEMYGVSRGTVQNYLAAAAASAKGAPPAVRPTAVRVASREVYTPEERREKVAAWLRLREQGVHRVEAARRVGVNPGNLRLWQVDIENGRDPGTKSRVDLPRGRQIAAACDIVSGRLTARQAEEKYGPRVATLQRFVSKLERGVYGDKAALLAAHEPKPQPAPTPTIPASPPPPPPPAPPPPKPEPEPEPVAVEERHLFTPPPPRPFPPVRSAPLQVPQTSAAQVIIDRLCQENDMLKAENARLKAKVQSLLHALSHE